MPTMSDEELLLGEAEHRIQALNQHLSTLATKTAVLVGFSGAALGAVIGTSGNYPTGASKVLFIALVAAYSIAVVFGLLLLWPSSMLGGDDPRQVPAATGRRLIGHLMVRKIAAVDRNQQLAKSLDLGWRIHAGFVVSATLLTAAYALVVSLN